MDKHHIIYRTTNLLNNRYYIGMHSTENIDDGYLGSGRRIKAEIKKYGKENFVREVLEELPTREALKLREAEIVNVELLADKRCLNLKDGGEGGFYHLNNGSVDHTRRRSKGTINSNKSPNRNWAAQSKKMLNTRRERGFVAFNGKHDNFVGKTHSQESKDAIGRANSIAQLGEKNSQYGTCWVKKDGSSLKINKQELIEYLQNGYSKGRTIKAAMV